jgi:hypothetical protein
VSLFLDLRPDVFATHQKSKRLAILEFTRAMDSSDDWEVKKDAEKGERYATVLALSRVTSREQLYIILTTLSCI